MNSQLLLAPCVAIGSQILRALNIGLCLALVSLFTNESAGAVDATLTPASMSSTSPAPIVLQITSLTTGESVVVERFIDANANGTVDAGEFLAEVFTVIDGQMPTIGGVRNTNVPGDEDSVADGQISIHLRPAIGPELGRGAGEQIIQVSAPSASFAALARTLTITQVVQPQSITGTVIDASSAPVPYASVFLLDVRSEGKIVFGAVSDTDGKYTVSAPVGSYVVLAFKPGYISTFDTTTALVLGAGTTLTRVVELAPATTSISGTIADAATSTGLGGVQFFVQSDTGLFTVSSSNSNGSFLIPVTSAQWQMQTSENSLRQLGYLSPYDDAAALVDTTGGAAAGVNINVPKATALVYGTVKDDLGNPVIGADIVANGQVVLYRGGARSIAPNGNYTLGVSTGEWWVAVQPYSLPEDYVASASSDVMVSAGQAVLADLVVHSSQMIPAMIAANPAQGFSWPYYLFVPTTAGTSTTLLIEPSNTGSSEDFAFHDIGAQAAVTRWKSFAIDLGCPLLIPVFPRSSINWQVYTHALDRDTLLTNLPGLRRIDLQLIAMIDDARARLSAEGRTVGRKVFIMGFSASGMFANRFTVLHPDRVQAASIGSPGGWPLAPVSTWQGQALRYNIGISDVAALTGSTPDLATFLQVPQYFYLGDQDTNDSVPFTDSYEAADAILVNQLFGSTPVARWPKAQEIYESIHANARFVQYPGVGHSQSAGIVNDIKHFFSEIAAIGGTSFTVNEEAHSVDIPIVRSAGVEGPLSLNISTKDGSALAGSDYQAITDEEVNLATGVTSVNVPITILNNPPFTNEANETFTVSINSPGVGTAIGSPFTATVHIIDSVDATIPGVPVVANPAANSTLKLNTAATLNVTGTAKDNKGVKQVQVSFNGGQFTDAVLTPVGSTSPLSTNYSLAVVPKTGANTVSVKSIDHRNNTSAIVTRSFKVWRPLGVPLTGAGTGTVTAGFSPTSFREAGKSFTITATPTMPVSPTIANPGSVFTGWTVADLPGMNQAQTLAKIGVAASSLTKATLTFTFRADLELTAHFEKNPYPGLAGTYNGLLRGTGTTPLGASLRSVSTEGYFTATIDAKGGFSGKLTVDGSLLPAITMVGSFDETGTARFGTSRTTTVTVARLNKPSLTVGPLHVVDTDGAGVPGGQRIDGTVTATDFKRSVVTGVSTILAERAFYGTQVAPGSIALGSPVVTMVTTADRTAGELVTGTGIPAGAKILSVNSATQITLDKNATATNAAASLTFTRNVASAYLGAANADGSYTMVLRSRAPHYEVPVTFNADNTVDAGADNLFQNDSMVVFKGTLPSPLVAGQVYYVINKSGNTFELSLTQGGGAIDIDASGSAVAVLDPDARQIEGFTARDYPRGVGVATVKLSKTGTLTCTATLADGTALTPSSTLSSAGTVPLFAQLYGLKGFFSTLVKLKDLPLNNADPDLLPAPNSEVLWLRPFMLDQYYPDGWPRLLKVDLLGARYDPAIAGGVLRRANNMPLVAADLVDGNAALIFGEGKLSENVVKAVSISTTNAVTKVPDPVDPTFSLKITPATGVVSGSFIHTDDNSTAFQGIIFQKGASAGAYGFFKSRAPLIIDYTGESGGVSLLGK